MLPRESKLLLANIIRHTDTHNRILEEEECWKQRSLQRMNEAKTCSQSFARNGGEMNYSCRNELGKVLGKPKAHMDCEDDTRRRSYEGREEKPCTFWMRQLDKVEAGDPDRWGHSGYKELYPQDFISDSERDKTEEANKRILSKKRRHSPEEKPKRKRKKKVDKKVKDKKKAKKKKIENNSDSESREKRHHSHHSTKKHKKEDESSSQKDKKKRHKKHKHD